MKQESIWLEEIKTEVNEPLNKDITCNILIIGGGMAGINTALHLKDEKDVVLIDKDKIGYGVTSHTTGKLTYLQGTMNVDILKSRDLETAIKYIESQKYAIELAKDIIEKYDIDCNLEKNDSYLFTSTDKTKLTEYKDLFTKANINYEEEKLPINIPCVDAIKVKDTYVFHPIKYIEKLKEVIKESNVQIYENTTAIDLDIKDDYYEIKTGKAKIKAKKLIICTHYPFFIIPGLIPLKLSLYNSYALSAKQENENFNAINIDEETYSVRYYKDNIIVGGFSHPLYNHLDYKSEEDKLITFYQKHFKGMPDKIWQTHDLTSHDYLPLIGRLNEKHPNLLIATAFNKWGMTNGILAGKILSDLIKNKENKYENLFKLNRKITLKETLNFVASNFMIGTTLVNSKLNKNKDFYNKSYVTNINGISCGVYTDKEGKEHIVKNTCPHFKCSLIFNNADKTWDCPCHGSRFDIDGNLIEGPSVFDIKIDIKNKPNNT